MLSNQYPTKWLICLLLDPGHECLENVNMILNVSWFATGEKAGQHEMKKQTIKKNKVLFSFPLLEDLILFVCVGKDFPFLVWTTARTTSHIHTALSPPHMPFSYRTHTSRKHWHIEGDLRFTVLPTDNLTWEQEEPISLPASWSRLILNEQTSLRYTD